MLNHKKLERDLVNLNKSYTSSVEEYAKKHADILYEYFLNAEDITGDKPKKLDKIALYNLILKANTSYSKYSYKYVESAIMLLVTNATFKTSSPPPAATKEISSKVTVVPRISLAEIYHLNDESIEQRQKKYARKIKEFALGLKIDINYMTNSTPPVPAVLTQTNIR